MNTDAASLEELQQFLQSAPDTKMLEVFVVDINGILRGKRIPRSEFETFFTKGLKYCPSSTLMTSAGDLSDTLGMGLKDGDPDKLIYPVANTLATVPWLKSPTAQVLASYNELDGKPCYLDPRSILKRALQPLQEMGLNVVVATELEFYLLESTQSEIPQRYYSRIPTTSIKPHGSQYSMLEDLWDHDDFLDNVRRSCDIQQVPSTTAHSEFASGQFEINLHHVDDVVTACDHSVLLKRVIKGEARRHDMGACFMAKPFADSSGNGLHIHISVYDQKGNNIFADASSKSVPPISNALRYAVGGLAQIMPDAMALYAPNANSYRRLQPNSYAPLSPNWGYNHRCVSLRIPVSEMKDTRIEHRVAGADANPYLVMASILGGIHHGLTQQCDPGEMIKESEVIEKEHITLPTHWHAALDQFENSELLKSYLGTEYHSIYTTIKRDECNEFNAQINPLDYQWYLRSV